jgi:hypothetical protein
VASCHVNENKPVFIKVGNLLAISFLNSFISVENSFPNNETTSYNVKIRQTVTLQSA